MIQIERGDLLSQERGILVHGCNCLGVMGAGFALALARKYPSVKAAYVRYHRQVGLKLGDVLFVRPAGGKMDIAGGLPLPGQEFAVAQELPPELVIANAMTQQEVGGYKVGRVDLDYEALSQCFETVRRVAHVYSLPVIFPMIGCGLAGGSWEKVAPRIEKALGPDVEKVLWIPV